MPVQRCGRVTMGGAWWLPHVRMCMCVCGMRGGGVGETARPAQPCTHKTTSVQTPPSPHTHPHTTRKGQSTAHTMSIQGTRYEAHTTTGNQLLDLVGRRAVHGAANAGGQAAGETWGANVTTNKQTTASTWEAVLPAQPSLSRRQFACAPPTANTVTTSSGIRGGRRRGKCVRRPHT